jgi:cystathionine beta-lyase
MRDPKAPSSAAALSKSTRLLHAGSSGEPVARTVAPPIQRGSTVLLPDAKSLYDARRPTYGRMGLSAQAALAEAVGELEGAPPARLFPSGLAAVTGVLQALLAAGDEVLVADCAYGPTRRFCENVLRRYGVTTRYVPADAGVEAVFASASERTRLILLESPGSLTFDIQDVPAIAAEARSRGVLTAIDNTWGAGVLYDPLTLGADISIQALTKYVGGHSDAFMGSACSRDPGVLARIDAFLRDCGIGVAPDEWLQEQPEVLRVLCPALPGAPGHALWTRDFMGLNGLFGVVLQPGSESAVEAFINALQLFGLGFSWGGFESLAIHCDPQLRRPLGMPALGGPLIRLHVGLEDPGDLIADLRQALDVYAAAASIDLQRVSELRGKHP